MPLLTDKLHELAGTLAELKDRVRTALAGELARVVADAVRDVVQAVLRRDPEPEPVARGYPSVGRSWHDPVDPWADDTDPWASGSPPTAHRPDRSVKPAGFSPDATLALAAGAAVTRWWARRTGRVAAAAGLGLAVATLGAFGPAGRAALAVITAAAELLAVPDLLSAAADRFGRRSP